MKFSQKRAAKNSFWSVLISLVPGTLAWAVGRNWLTDQDAAFIGLIVTTLASAYAGNGIGFHAAKTDQRPIDLE